MDQSRHLAQINIAKAIAPLDDPIMKGFVDELDRINSLADKSAGFVWRLQTEIGGATNMDPFKDGRTIVNMSVWDSIESLKNYVYSGEHLAIFRQKKLWFQKIDTPPLALWWITAGTIPTITDGKNALMNLQMYGSSADAFTFAKPCL